LESEGRKKEEFAIIGMKLFIKNMVCTRCKMVVKSELDKLGLHYTMVELGEAEIMEDISESQLNRLDLSLRESGLELMSDRQSILVEMIKTTIIDLIHSDQTQLKINLSDYLSEKLNHNYTYLSNLFSKIKGTTIEKYYLSHKIERVKELLLYDELNLTEIAYTMHYSSVAHLSNQFKKMTGLTPSHFKSLRYKRRTMLGDL
jgi:YesN/AraC family two-component response regulator